MTKKEALEALERGDDDVRCRAMEALASSATEEALEPIVACLRREDNWRVRSSAARALRAFPLKSEDVVVLARLALVDESIWVRRSALSALEGVDPEGEVRCAVALGMAVEREKGGEQVQVEVLKMLSGYLARPGVLEAVRAGLSGPMWSVRAEAVRALSQVSLADSGRLSEVVSVVRGALGDPDAAVREAAVRGLGRLAPELWEEWGSALAVDEAQAEGVRLAAIRQLLNAPEEARASVVDALRGVRPGAPGVSLALTVETLRLLEVLGAASVTAFDDILGCLQHEHSSIRMCAGDALRALSRALPEVSKRLVEGLEGRSEQVRRRIVLALGQQDGSQAAALQILLTMVLHDQSGSVRDAASWMLAAEAQTEPVLEALSSGLSDQRVRVRQRAVAALRKLGSRARSVAVPVARALRDPGAAVRKEACLTAGRLDAAAIVVPELVRRSFEGDRRVARAGGEVIRGLKAHHPEAVWGTVVGVQGAEEALEALLSRVTLSDAVTVRFVDACAGHAEWMASVIGHGPPGTHDRTTLEPRSAAQLGQRVAASVMERGAAREASWQLARLLGMLLGA